MLHVVGKERCSGFIDVEKASWADCTGLSVRLAQKLSPCQGLGVVAAAGLLGVPELI